MLLDLELFTPPDTMLIQDRHWLSQLGRNRFFHPDRELIPDGLRERRHIPFERNVLLTSSLDAKQERARERTAKSPRDRYLVEHPDAHQHYEEFLRELLPDDEDWLVLDTTGQCVDEVVDAVRAALKG
jgi:hypothetical protein